jgi:hypothetical protein
VTLAPRCNRNGCVSAPIGLSQGIIYRLFLFDRWGIVLVSAAAFGFVHIVFRNALAVALTLRAGLLFAVRHWQTGSLMASSFEHALYGCAILTIGLGHWFYHGAVPHGFG